MRRCIVCQKEFQERTETQKYCERLCKRAAYLNLTREEHLAQREQRKKRDEEETRRAEKAGHGNCVIFRDDGGYNRQYLADDGTWTGNRGEAARCLNGDEADALARKHGVAFFGGPSEAYPTCDVLVFRLPEYYDRWVDDWCNEIDAENAEPTEKFIEASLVAAVPGLRARAILRGVPVDKSNGGQQDTSHRP